MRKFLYILLVVFFVMLMGSTYIIKKDESRYIKNVTESAIYFQNPSRVLLKVVCIFDEAMYSIHQYQFHKDYKLLEPELLFLSAKSLLSNNKDYKPLLDYINKIITKINNKEHIDVVKDMKEFHRILNKVSFFEFQKSIQFFNKYKENVGQIQTILYTIMGIIIILTFAFVFILYQTNLLKKVQTLSETDQLTQVYNRRKFFSEIKDYKKGYSLIMFDIDHFKRINDTYGHDKGDFVLKKLVNTIKENIRKDDMIFRWGGEEFFILFKGMDLDEAQKIAEKLRKIIEYTNFDGVNITISLSVVTTKDNKNIEDIIKQLDDGLYEAKNSGRNKVIVKGVV